MNLYKITFSFISPQIAEVAVLASSPEEADARVRNAFGPEALEEMKFKVASCELLEENLEVDEAEVIENYKQTDKRILN